MSDRCQDGMETAEYPPEQDRSESEDEETQQGEREMAFLDHLEELRWRILKALAAVVVGAILCFSFSDYLLHVLTAPIRSIGPPLKLIFLHPVGMFLVRLELSLVSGLVLALPIVLYQAWQFIAPGLLKQERRYVLPVIFLTLLCFLVGASLAYWVVIPIALRFLSGMGTADIAPQFDIGKYIGFLLRLIVAFGLVFELPMVSYFLTKMGILTPAFMRRARKYAVIGVFVIAAVLTPPDIFSQLMMAVPLLGLYEISILVCGLAAQER